MAKKVSQAFVQGMAWVLSYYCHGNHVLPGSPGVQNALRPNSGGEVIGATWDW